MTSTKTEQERAYDEFLRSLPAPPAGISIDHVRSICDPDGPGHPYMIGASHVAHAADHFSGILDETAISSAERSGSYCKYEHRGQRCNRPWSEHKQVLTLFVIVPQNKDLNAVPGLGAYLTEIKPACEAFGIEGFAFPTPEQAVTA